MNSPFRNSVAVRFLPMLAMLAVSAAGQAPETPEGKFDEQVRIPAGEFIFGDGTTAKTGEFSIDKYEVTIGQYAKFVEWLEQNKDQQHVFDHPRQPAKLSHVPDFWPIYYGQARRGGAAHSSPISLHSPMMALTWWDAYAYAKWTGRDLPTELEWEKAARGEKGSVFPWGDEADLRRANTNADYDERHPGALASIDGSNYWGDVDKHGDDKSPYGVIGMAGNVSEWVGDWVDRHPVIKGGNFTIALQPSSARIVNRLPEDAQEFIGFRTISRTPVAKSPPSP
ncbi:MAG TPA: SUMF1/EgtB/PvdO family nonheme iron enzyme [Chthoniobacteraceae bacterium]|jgi:formylglycine-generating enzyme required for sulfatase activity|nr:SUMF1/EgtB/PvdO family nonheme iron enzyme [Chthoniobacteraceae bacterium]